MPGEVAVFAAVSNTTVKLCALDASKAPQIQWQDSSTQAQTSAQWLRNGKAFLSTQGGSVVAHVMDALKDVAQPILNLSSGPLLARISGDNKSICIVQLSATPGSLQIYDLQALLQPNAAPSSKVPVTLSDHDRSILALAASPSTTHMATSNAAGSVYLHDAGPGARATLGLLPSGPALVTPKRCLAFSQANKPLRLAAGADDGQVLLWQISPQAAGPVVLPTKLRGRVMGVAFGTYGRVMSSVLVCCSESGQLVLTDLTTFPEFKAPPISLEMHVGVACMAVRDDGAVLAVGTKDGRVGLSFMDELVLQKSGNAKHIRVFDLGTHLDVNDIAFQRFGGSRDSRDSRDGAPATAAATTTTAAAAAAITAPQVASAEAARAEGRRGAGAAEGKAVSGPGAAPQPQPPLKESTNNHTLPTGAQRLQQQASGGAGAALAAASLPGSKPPGPAVASSASAVTAGPGQSQPQPGMGPYGATGVAGSGAAATGAASRPPASSSGPSSAAQAYPQASAPTAGSSQPTAGRSVPALVPPLAIPGATHRRPSDSGGAGGGGGAAAPAGPGAMEDAAGPMDGQLVSPAARAMAAAGVGGASPLNSPSRQPSPRASNTGIALSGGLPASRPPTSSGIGSAAAASGYMAGAAVSSAEVLSGNLRSYLDDMQSMVRDLVFGLQADMVRQSVNNEMAMRDAVAGLAEENRALREDVARLSTQLDTALRFGLLGQQRGPWQ